MTHYIGTNNFININRLALCLLLLTSGCMSSAPLRTSEIIPNRAQFEIEEHYPFSISVNADISPNAMNRKYYSSLDPGLDYFSNIPRETLVEALSSSIRNSGLFSEVIMDGDARYHLDWHISSIIPSGGVRIKFVADWVLTDTATRSVLFRGEIKTSDEKTIGDHLLGSTRTRIMSENALKANLQEGLYRLSLLDLTGERWNNAIKSNSLGLCAKILKNLAAANQTGEAEEELKEKLNAVLKKNIEENNIIMSILKKYKIGITSINEFCGENWSNNLDAWILGSILIVSSRSARDSDIQYTFGKLDMVVDINTLNKLYDASYEFTYNGTYNNESGILLNYLLKTNSGEQFYDYVSGCRNYDPNLISDNSKLNIRNKVAIFKEVCHLRFDKNKILQEIDCQE